MTVSQRAMTRLFFNPHIKAASVIARVAVCFTTLLWAVIVLAQLGDKALEQYSSVRIFGNAVAFAIAALAFGGYQLWETFTWRRQIWLSDAASAFMTLLWTAILISFFVYLKPLPPAGTASTACIALLSWWNVLVAPRKA